MGAALLAAGRPVAVGRAIRMASTVPGAMPLWPLLYLTFLLIYKLLEGVIVALHSILWVLYVVAVTSVAVTSVAVHTRETSRQWRRPRPALPSR